MQLQADKVSGASDELLQPGVYCGGLKITNGATVALTAGTFIVKDGPLMVDRRLQSSGNSVSIYIKGAGRQSHLRDREHDHLTAGKSGPLSGILIFDDPTGAQALSAQGSGSREPAPPTSRRSPREHTILSDDAGCCSARSICPRAG